MLNFIFLGFILFTLFHANTANAMLTGKSIFNTATRGNVNSMQLYKKENELFNESGSNDEKNTSMLSYAKNNPFTTSLIATYAAEGILDILASNKMAENNFTIVKNNIKYFYHETDPLLGKFPSYLQYSLEAPIIFGIAAGIVMNLPENVRIPFSIAAVAFEGYNVATMIATFSLSTFAFPVVIVGLVAGFGVTWLVYHAIHYIMNYFHEKNAEDITTLLLNKYYELNNLKIEN